MNPNNESLITFPSVTTELEAALIVYLLLLAEQEIDATQSERLTSQFQAEAWGAVQVMVLQDQRAVTRAIIAENDTVDTRYQPERPGRRLLDAHHRHCHRAISDAGLCALTAPPDAEGSRIRYFFAVLL